MNTGKGKKATKTPLYPGRVMQATRREILTEENDNFYAKSF